MRPACAARRRRFLLDWRRTKDENPRVPISPPKLAALLRDLGPQLLRGDHAQARGEEAATALPTGHAALDALLGGGFPRGRLSEIAGPSSSGCTSLALSLLARTTQAEEVVAVVDAADAFDPRSAERSGVALGRVLWARPTGTAEAVRCGRRLLEARGFGLIVLDLARAGPGALPALSRATWQQLARAARAAHTALVALCFARQTGTCAELALELTPRRANFAGSPPLLESLEVEARLARHRTRPHPSHVVLRLGPPAPDA
jgi:recA bacterial DNA recombination protein